MYRFDVDAQLHFCFAVSFSYVAIICRSNEITEVFQSKSTKLLITVSHFKCFDISNIGCMIERGWYAERGLLFKRAHSRSRQDNTEFALRGRGGGRGEGEEGKRRGLCRASLSGWIHLGNRRFIREFAFIHRSYRSVTLFLFTSFLQTFL